MLQRFVDFNRLAKPHCYRLVCLYAAQIHQTQYYRNFYILQFVCSIPLINNFTSHLLTSKSLKFFISLSRGITIIHSFIHSKHNFETYFVSIFMTRHWSYSGNKDRLDPCPWGCSLHYAVSSILDLSLSTGSDDHITFDLQ